MNSRDFCIQIKFINFFLCQFFFLKNNFLLIFFLWVFTYYIIIFCSIFNFLCLFSNFQFFLVCRMSEESPCCVEAPPTSSEAPPTGVDPLIVEEEISDGQKKVKIAVVGCSHGEMDLIYDVRDKDCQLITMENLFFKKMEKIIKNEN